MFVVSLAHFAPRAFVKRSSRVAPQLLKKMTTIHTSCRCIVCCPTKHTNTNINNWLNFCNPFWMQTNSGESGKSSYRLALPLNASGTRALATLKLFITIWQQLHLSDSTSSFCFKTWCQLQSLNYGPISRCPASSSETKISPNKVRNARAAIPQISGLHYRNAENDDPT